MSTELATQDYSQEKVNLIKQLVAKDCTDLELELFLYTCRKTGLDPLARQIYAIKRGGKMSIQTGIDGYRVIADRTGQLAGISDYMFPDDAEKYPFQATVTVKKLIEPGSGLVADFTATARWGEYNAGGPMWQKMPFLMLGKCAEALALRKAFPADLSGVYTAEEMAQAGPDDSEQRDAVFAEVERQKTATNTKLVEMVAPEKISYAEHVGTLLPPELDWSYNSKTGVLICRLLEVKKSTKKAGGDYVAMKINGSIDGKEVISYFHKTHQDELLKAAGKVCKFMVVPTKGGYFNVDTVLEIDGVRMPDKPTPPEAVPPSKEEVARWLASTLDYDEESLREVHGSICGGDWAKVVAHLEGVKSRREAGDAV